jgi:nitrogen fixation NifU-like protein
VTLYDELGELYQEVIMDHNRSPRNHHRLARADATVQGHNPLCGDSLTLDVALADGTVTDVGWEGVGCAISKASASLMTEAVKGRSVEEAKALYDQFHHLVTRDAPADADALGKLRVFSGVGEFPARVKCAKLPWRTLMAAIEGETDAVTTEA